MFVRALIWAVLLTSLWACNQLLDIREPADEIWTPDAATGTDSQSITDADEDAGSED